MSGSGRRHRFFFFGGGCYRGWKEKAPWSMEFELFSLHVTPSNRPKFMYLCSVLYVLGVIKTLEGWSGSQDTELPILYKQPLQWGFHCMRLQTCVGSVCVGDTTLMCRGRECARWGSATRHFSFYASLVGGGLRPSGTSSGSTGSVRICRSVIRTIYT